MTTAAARGERLIGVRLGGPVTRRAPWRIADGDPVLGWLTESMRLPSGQPAPGPLASPQVVPHLAVVLGGQLAGPGISAADALAAVASVHAAAWLAGSPSAEDGWYLASPAGRPPAGVDLALEACLVEVAGQVVDSGTGAAAAGHPAEALAWAANALAARGHRLEPGWVVLAGALTSPVTVPEGGSLAVHFTTLGSLFLPPETLAIQLPG